MAYVYKHIEPSLQNEQSVHIYTSAYPKGAESLFHIHQFFELEIIAEGSGVNSFKGFEYPVTKGSTYIIAPPIGHKKTLNKNSKVYTVSFRDYAIRHPSILKQLKLNCNYSNLNELELQRVISYIEQLSDLRDSNDKYTEETRSALLTLILITVLKDSKVYSVWGGNSTTPQKIQSALDYIYNNCGRDISLPEVAEYVSLSPNHFGHLFLKSVGLTFSNFLLQLRLENSKALLLENNLSLSEICKEVGFNSTSYFIKKFKEHYGTTPKNYKL